MARTGYVYDDRYLWHDPGAFHVERPDRLRAIHQRLQDTGLIKKVVAIAPFPAPLEWITTLHDPGYIERFRRACEKGQPILDTGDCGICPKSYEIALLAVGGVLAAADAIMQGTVNNAFCAIRPPGHHAERNRAMGFCFFNNIALGARYLQKQHGLKKVAIVDWDVHHGNGTQHLFETDPTVLYISLHQDPYTLYPGTGKSSEIGQGAGVGTTLNLPMPPGSTDADYLQALEQRVLPALQAFAPEFLLISAGFDAHADDPLANIQLTEAGYREMGTRLAAFAKEVCQGRLLTVLEGGYNLSVLAACVADHIRILLGN
ncbi:MAG: histone deacetylase family protein [Desulfobacca sp.]|uniref:histone deacetylase family protein n=1 Tax=Desulfobacca sp. TaxID=2067990 RepID=UPI00404A992E